MQAFPPSPPRPAPRSWLLARLLGVYLVVTLGLPLLRLAHRWPVAHTSWWWVTCPLWLPWVLCALGWGLYLLPRRRRRQVPG